MNILIQENWYNPFLLWSKIGRQSADLLGFLYYELYGRVFSSERDTDDWRRWFGRKYNGRSFISERAKTGSIF